MANPNSVAAVLIGRNEGARLSRALGSLQGAANHIIYVDSGSTDHSLEIAREAGAEVIELDPTYPFTAARARNAGLDALRSSGRQTTFIQFIDGDCELQPGWLAIASAFLNNHPNVAIVCGRRRERFPNASVYNRLCDAEWDTQIGRTKSCGGDALIRTAALNEVGGYDPRLIAGEEPEMCIRLREKGWEIWRLDTEMTLHDAAMTHFPQWWKRMRRGGHAAAEGMALHGYSPEYHGVAQVCRSVFWGLALPLLTLILAFNMSWWAIFLLLMYFIQISRIALRKGGGRAAWELAFFLTLGKFAEMTGAIEYWIRRLIGRPAGIIEHRR